MSDVGVLAGGSPHAHDFASTGAALVELAASAGHRCELIAHPDDAVSALDALDALVVCGLWWRMLGDVYDAWRAEHAYSPPEATRAALDRFVRDGGGLVAVHTAPICFDDWPGWRDVIGGAWRWGVSSHPPRGPVAATLVTEHPVLAGLPPVMQLDDEVYGDLDVRDDVEVLAVARRDADDDDQPVVWAHHHGAGRVVFDGFGHDADSIRHPDNARLLRNGLAWVLGACG